jgi:hypothetical protein
VTLIERRKEELANLCRETAIANGKLQLEFRRSIDALLSSSEATLPIEGVADSDASFPSDVFVVLQPPPLFLFFVSLTTALKVIFCCLFNRNITSHNLKTHHPRPSSSRRIVSPWKHGLYLYSLENRTSTAVGFDHGIVNNGDPNRTAQ